MVEEYHETVKREEDELFQSENEKYLEALKGITTEEVEDFFDEGDIPKRILEIVTLSPKDMCFYFKLIPDMKPTTGGYVFDDIQVPEEVDEVEGNLDFSYQ